jgi:3-phosphoshikimate 1-carboxyvinyltransferase
MSEQTMKFIIKSGGKISGSIRVPGDKSISHRSIILGSIAEGKTVVKGFLEGDDALATINAFRDMGVKIDGPKKGKVTIHGVGKKGLMEPAKELDLGNSGTSMRLLAGLMAGQKFITTLRGDESLSKRPMSRVAKPLRDMGVRVYTQAGGRPPITINGQSAVEAINYEMPIASAQVKSCVLLAGLYAKGYTSVTEPAPTRDHTERMLQGFGYKVKRDGATTTIRGGSKLTATKIDVPADISSAAFFMVAASIAAKSSITLKHVGVNPTRIGVINILRAMGADIELLKEKEVGGEPVADIRIKYAKLQGVEIPEDQVPLAIDEFPAIFIAAACAEGTTILRGAKELRVKESDRIQVMADGLKTLGVKVETTADGIIIEGAGSDKVKVLEGGEIESHNDHRIAMAFSIAALRAKAPIEISGCETVASSFPGFAELAASVGLKITVEEQEPVTLEE